MSASLADFLEATVQNGASDLHIRSDEPARMRVNGELIDITSGIPLDSDTVADLIRGVMSDENRGTYDENHQVDFAIGGNFGRFRVNVFKSRGNMGAVFRALPMKIPSLEDIGPAKVLKKLASLDNGLVLVTGATGSGKSTTLASMVDYINRNATNKHIITIEDPIEFSYDSNKSLITQREVGRDKDVNSFAEGIRGALREDPDVILVGEMRDLESIRNALTAAETGHLVLATLHSNSAPSTINRVIDIFPEGDKPLVRAQLATTLAGVVTQRLFPRADGKGRVAAHEIMLRNPAIQQQIRSGKIEQMPSTIQTQSKLGMILMEDSVKNLVEEGVIKNPEWEIDFDGIETLDEQSKAGLSGNFSNTRKLEAS